MSSLRPIPWPRLHEIEDFLLKSISIDDFVVEIGPGSEPFRRANEYIDAKLWNATIESKTKILDIELQPLPYADKQIDFIYCSHVLEDLSSPALLCREMSRVAKKGFVSTPSPLTEWWRNPLSLPHVRGLAHHRWFIWNTNRTLHLLPKYPIVETFSFDGEIEQQVTQLLMKYRGMWNTYYLWEGDLEFKLWRNDFDISPVGNYRDTILSALQQFPPQAMKWIQDFGMDSGLMSPS